MALAAELFPAPLLPHRTRFRAGFLCFSVRRGSEFEVSELRVVLLGGSCTERRDVGNFILRVKGFNSEPQFCVRVSGTLESEKKIAVINTPDPPVSTNNKMTEFIKACKKTSHPGPHVFLLVVQPKGFTENHKNSLCRVLEKFSERSFDHSLILMLPPRKRSAGMERLMLQPPLKELIRKSRYRYVVQKNLELPELLTRFDQIVKENNGEHLMCEVFDTSEDLRAPSAADDQNLRPAGRLVEAVMDAVSAFRVVLLGKSDNKKTKLGNLIVGHQSFHEKQSSFSVASCGEFRGKAVTVGEVCGRGLSLLELPALCGKAQQAVMEESFRCVSLCDPEGVHAFILVLPVGPLTDEDKMEVEILQDAFGSQLKDFMVVLFTVESDPTDPAVVNFVEGTTDIQELCQRCGGRSLVFNIRDEQQVPELLQEVERRRVRGAKGFDLRMLSGVVMEKIMEQKNINAELKATMKAKLKEEKEKLENEREKQLSEMKEKIQQERDERKKEQEIREEENRRKKKEEEYQQQEWQQKLDGALEESKEKMRQQQEKWEEERKQWWENRQRDDEQRREKEHERVRKLQEEYDQERKKYDEQKKKEDRLRQEQEEKERREMEENYKEKLEEMRKNYEEEARKQAEEFNEFKQKYTKDFTALVEKHMEEMLELKKKHERQIYDTEERRKKESSLLQNLSKHKEKHLREEIESMKRKQQEEIEYLRQQYKSQCAIL
ncbi:unnamed protein product [Menidia menidia]|uniref:(Atlantic silverside) hypothetical protein n=1 Tax=Menidia menidia TaxID=238744 RepID=A0A8S4AV42_9TELE|nr:unnamed protein product [Menidia menidia]